MLVTSEILHIQELEQYDPNSDKYPRTISLLARQSARYNNSNT
jgi:hypothetical protein